MLHISVSSSTCPTVFQFCTNGADVHLINKRLTPPIKHVERRIVKLLTGATHFWDKDHRHTVEWYCKADDNRLTDSKYGPHAEMCSACKGLNNSAFDMLNQPCTALVEQMDIGAVRAALESEHVEEDTTMVVSRLLQNRLNALESE